MDRAVFHGDYDEYAILISATWNDSVMSVVDFYTNRDGVDTLVQVEEFEFNGDLYSIQDLLNSDDDMPLPLNHPQKNTDWFWKQSLSYETKGHSKSNSACRCDKSSKGRRTESTREIQKLGTQISALAGSSPWTSARLIWL